MDLINQINNLIIVDNLENAEQEAVHERRYFKNCYPFITLTEAKFIKHFRLSKPAARDLIEMLDPLLLPPMRTSAIDKETKVLIALNFFGTGSYQTSVGSNVICGGVSQASASRCINEVVAALNHPEIFDNWIKFPNTLELLQHNRHRFFEEYQIPGIIGVIDCTHVAIFPPSERDELYPEYIYVNRKNYHSLNVQLICDIDLKIMNVNARFPGSTHDSYIWNNSNIAQEMINLYRRQQGFYLIGDMGYALRPWLQVPLRGAVPGTPEYMYNEAFKRSRSLIERCNGVLKMRFRCLLKHRVLHYRPTKASKIVNACAVLHNMCIENNIPEPIEEENDNDLDLGMYVIFEENQQPLGVIQGDLIAGRQLQERIINNYFRVN